MGQDVGEATTGRLEAARDAHERQAWLDAYHALKEIDAAEPLGPDDLARYAETAWFAGDPDTAFEARRRAHAAYTQDGDRCGAALMAVHLASGYFDRGEFAVATGWVGRTARILEKVDGLCPAHAWHALLQTAIAVQSGDASSALELAQRTQELADKLGDESLVAVGMEFEGMAKVRLGEIDEGMALIDEATVAVTTGELDPTCTGIVYCCTIDTCRTLTDWERARQWTEEAERWCGDHGLSGFPGVCRVHRAEILGLRGSWADAEREARRAADELRPYDVMLRAEALYQVGELRRRVGDLEGARQVFAEVRDLGRDPEPAASLLRLEAGDAAGAHAQISRVLEERTGLDRLRQLPEAIDISIDAGELEHARELAAELAEAATSMRKPALEASASVARGRLLLAEGDGAAAAAILRHAVEHWLQVGAPYDVAIARTLRGEALRSAGDDEAAGLELESARTAFERLGAIADVRRVDTLLGREGGIAVPAGDRVTRTFVFTDIVGSTTLAETLGDTSWQELIRWHDQELRSHFERRGGAEVRHTGDGFFVAFPDASAAIEASVAIQRALAEHRRAHGFAPPVRIGVHEAEATVRGHDYMGVGVHAAARIGALAAADEILVSRAAVDAATVRFPLSEPRTVELKGVSEPVEVAAVEWR